MKRKKNGIIITFFSILLLIALVIGLGVAYYNSKLDLLDYDHPDENAAQPTPTPIVDVEDEPFEDLDLSVHEVKDIVGELPEGDIFEDSDVVNILLLGTDERSAEFSENARADSMMVISLNKKLGTVKLVSFERGLGVRVPGRNDDWLTHTFRYGGAELTMNTISEYFLLDIDGYVRVNFHTFEQIINAVGGVDIELTELECQGLNGEVYTNAETRQHVTPGVNHLDGYDALQYCRLRYIDDDWHRIVRQRNTVQAVIYATKSLGLRELNNLLNETLPLVRTSLTKDEITSLLLSAHKFLGLTAEQMTMPADGTMWGRIGVDGRSLIDCDFAENAEILKEFLYGSVAE